MSNSFDTYLYRLINQTLSASWLDPIMFYFSDKLFWIPLYCVVIWFIIKNFKKKTLLILICFGIIVVAADRITSGILKPAFKRERPCHIAELTPRSVEGVYCSDTGSMPSSHAANHFAIAIFIVLLYGFKNRRLVLFWIGWATVIAYSRVYLGVHYPTDVLVGAAIGSIIGVLVFIGYRKLENKIKWLS
ncbi:MAG: phosphatase PAP2 family protein [Bacteroidota bacterium]